MMRFDATFQIKIVPLFLSLGSKINTTDNEDKSIIFVLPQNAFRTHVHMCALTFQIPKAGTRMQMELPGVSEWSW